MASAAVGCGSASGSWAQFNISSSSIRHMRNNIFKKRRGVSVSCVNKGAAVSDPYKTLRIRRGASESEVKKAFRQLALQYHPDVCRGKDSDVQFHQITEAYDTVMSSLRSKPDVPEKSMTNQYKDIDESLRYDEDDLWEEWMGWEGAGIRDYSSHINPYI